MTARHRRRISIGVVALAAAVGLGAVTAAPAFAGGPGTVYVYGATKAQCEVNLSNSYHSSSRHHEISGIHHCRRTGDGKRWFGDYVAS